MDNISVKCAGCGHAMKFAADKAGRKAKCPKCEKVLTIPEPSANGPAPAGDDDDAGYGVVVDHELEVRRRELEESERERLIALRRKKAPKIQKKFKSLPDADQWERVHFGLIFLFLGTVLWGFTHLLNGVWVGLGQVEFTDYSRLVTEQVERTVKDRQDRGDPDIPEDGRFWQFSQFHLLVGMVAGRGFVTFAKFCIVVNLILYPIQLILWVIGYILCLSVPKHHGAFGHLITMMALTAFNFLVFVFFKLIPVTGLYKYYLLPYFLPEVMITEYNMERVYPIFMIWSASPFFESILAMFLQFMLYLQPTMMSIFIWSASKSLKATRVEANAEGVTQTGFNQYFLWFCMLMFGLCGTTPVLIWVLRAFYILWYSALLMFITRSALLIWRFRDQIDFRLHPEDSLG
jgi:DNA-directed RNA polymerase subunit RPC12/RpoP